MKSVFKYAGLFLIAAMLILLLSACGQKEENTGIPAKVSKAKTEAAKKSKSSDTPVQAPQGVVPEDELVKTSTEIDAAVAEVDSVLKEIDQIDAGEDDVPSL